MPIFVVMDTGDIGFQVGQRIKSMRLARGFSQEKLAFAAGMQESYVGQIERGKKTVGLRNLVRFADALGCSIQDLLPSEAELHRDHN